ncbi:MAG: glycosyltransferase family 39 protein [Planctomycetota bacterium]|jgi:hypothetical protein
MTENNGTIKLAAACILVLAGLACIAGFLWLEHHVDGFNDRHGHGRTLEGGHRIFSLTAKEWLYFGGLFVFAFPAAIFLGFGISRIAGRPLDKFGETALRHGVFRKHFLDFAFGAGIVMAAVAVLTRWGVPITDDAVMYEFQACVFTNGCLTAPAHPVGEAFDGIFLVNNDAGRYAMYPFGYSFLLMPAVVSGLINLIPLSIITVMLTLGTVVLACKTTEKIWGEKTGRLVFLLVLLSPQMLFTASTLTSQTASAFFLMLGVYLLVRSGEGNRVLYLAAGAGASFGAALNVRPSSAFLWALPIGLILIYELYRKRNKSFRRLGGVLIGGSILVALYCGLNWRVNGSPFKSNYRAYWEIAEPELGKTAYIGFGEYPWDIEHTPAAGLRNAGMNLLRLNVWQTGLPVGLLLVIIGIVAARREKWGKVFPAVIAATFIFYFFYFWPGICETGPVLYYELLAPSIIFAALGLLRITDWIKTKERLRTRVSPTAFLIAFILVSVVTFHRVQFNTLRHTRKEVRRLHHPVASEQEELLRKPVVIIQTEPLQNELATSWVMGRIVHPLTFDEPLIFARDAGPEVTRRLMEAYPERDFYRLEPVPPVRLPDGTLRRAPGGPTRLVRIPR